MQSRCCWPPESSNPERLSLFSTSSLRRAILRFLVRSEMTGYHDAMEFEWDPDKAARNLAKHGVSFHEAATVFGDPMALTFSDPDHSQDEDRFLTFGHSVNGHLLIVSHTDRGDRTRIVSPSRNAQRRKFV